MFLENVTPIQFAATICFVLAILHTFSVKFFHKLGSKYQEGSIAENIFHFLGEVEVVFGLWAAVFFVAYCLLDSYSSAAAYLESSRFTEPVLVFVLMAVCSSKPILQLANTLIEMISKLIPLKNKTISFYFSALIVGPVLGSFITEPAAMTVTALVLLSRFYSLDISEKLKYATLGLLFVNVSVGGTFTHYAAPPVLMVATKWNWDTMYMVSHFGWKALVAMIISTSGVIFFFKKEFSTLSLTTNKQKQSSVQVPFWLVGMHILFLALIILNHHSIVLMISYFLFYLGIAAVTKEHQDELNLKSPMLVAFFLGGLVVLGGLQAWWLEPVLKSLNSAALYLGAIALTAVTDNAAITFLGSQVEGLSEASKYALVSGAVVGGGLTVIANAPNPAGYSILYQSFGKDGIGALGIFKGALWPTLVTLICFWIL